MKRSPRIDPGILLQMFEEEVGRGKKGEIHDTKDAYVKKKKRKEKENQGKRNNGCSFKISIKLNRV